MTPLRRRMRDYKRRNQRFDARINRMEKTFGSLEMVALLTEDTQKMMGYVIRFRDPFPRHVTSYELSLMTRDQFKTNVC
jgi:hypothetical protein